MSSNIIIPNQSLSPFNRDDVFSNDFVLLNPSQLFFQGKTYRCATGKGGIRVDKQEGDGATPVGTFPLRRLFYRQDRWDEASVAIITNTRLPTKAITPLDGWCDDPASPYYNQLVALPSPFRHECLWREESVYDLIIELGYNDDPIVPDKGSAIFMHLARADYSSTEGCIALSRKDMLEVLEGISDEILIKKGKPMLPF